MSCLYFVGDPFTRGRLRRVGLLYCILAGALAWGRFIDRFELGEVCICTLCAVKYKGGVSNGIWNAKSDGVHKTRTPQDDGDADDQGGRRNGDVTGWDICAAMNPAEQWTPNGSNSQRCGLYRVKRRLHERSSPGAAVRGEGNGRKTELVFAQPDGKREGARWREIR